MCRVCVLLNCVKDRMPRELDDDDYYALMKILKTYSPVIFWGKYHLSPEKFSSGYYDRYMLRGQENTRPPAQMWGVTDLRGVYQGVV